MKLLFNNEPCDASRVEVTQSEERVSTYLLQDGTVVKVRCILTGVWKFKDKLDGNGQPIYHINWHVVPSTEPTE